MCLGDFVSGLPPLSLFHFLARRPLRARLIAKSLCPSSSRAPKQDPDPAITGHACGRRKHKLGAEGVVGGRGCLGRGNASIQVHSAWRWNSARSAVATDPGAPLPTGRSSMRTTGMTIWLADVRKDRKSVV